MRELLRRLRATASRIGSSAPVAWIRRNRRPLAIIVLVGFLVFVVVYVALNPSIIVEALSIGWRNIGLLAVLYVGVMVTHFFVLETTIRISRNRLPMREGFLLTIYSTVSNFFGPLQSGPGIRAVYLKSRIGLRFRVYLAATLYYFFAFGVLNGSLLFLTTAPWLSGLGVLVGCLLVAVTMTRFGFADRWAWVVALAGVTAVQVLLMAVVYFVELNAVTTGPGYGFDQALVYAGSANLSLFVSITPGAIGIREAFLVFAQGLHGVDLDDIVAAGIVDRAFYALFLLVLFALSSMLNLGAMFRRGRDGDAEPDADAGDEPTGPTSAANPGEDRRE